jgi:hypothetical protein
LEAVMMRRVLGACVVVLACVGLLSSCALLPVVDETKTADVEMQHIADDVKHHNAAALKELFSKTALAKATDLDGEVRKFLSLFPSGFTSWSDPDGGPGDTSVNEGDGPTILLDGTYKVHANGKTYDLYFADFVVNQIHPDNVGLYALGVAPYNAYPGTKPTAASTAFFAWAGQYEIKTKNAEATGIPSVYVYEPAK